MHTSHISTTRHADLCVKQTDVLVQLQTRLRFKMETKINVVHASIQELSCNSEQPLCKCNSRFTGLKVEWWMSALVCFPSYICN